MKVKNADAKSDKNIGMPKEHSISTHNFHIKTYSHCLYCDSGSKPVADAMVKTKMGK